MVDMRRAPLLVLAVLALASCKLRGAGLSKLASLVSFEGEIDMSIGMAVPSTPGVASTIKLEIKGDKMRTETPGLGFVNITDAGKKKTWLLEPTAHTYTEMDLSSATAATATAPTTKSKATVVKTGRSDKVAGYSCDVYEVDDPSGAMSHTELCMASGLSMLAMGLTGPFAMFTKGNDAWSDVLSHGFPLRMIMRDASGAPLMKMEATKIEKKSLPDSEFEVPPGYTKTPSPFGLGGSGRGGSPGVTYGGRPR
jgi:outer membrane lipoprotein-sorting protein